MGKNEKEFNDFYGGLVVVLLLVGLFVMLLIR